MTGAQLHALSFDVEEYFQVANLRGFFRLEEWDEVESRIDAPMQKILDLLALRGARATFFFLGWIAERHPELVQRCLAGGHEVASHGYEHHFLQDLGREAFVRDLARTEAVLEAAGAERPRGFRASTFTLTKDTFWGFDVLVERGYRYDSSVHPVRHPVYGIPDFEPGISRVEAPGGGGSIIEFPVSTLPLFGRNLPVGGGGYFRLLPAVLTKFAFARLERSGRAGCLYLHPWEFDPDQPRVPAPLFKRFRHYLNLDRTLDRLDVMCRRFRFVGLEELLEQEGHLEHARDGV